MSLSLTIDMTGTPLAFAIDMTGAPLALTVDFTEWNSAGILYGYDFSTISNSHFLAIW